MPLADSIKIAVHTLNLINNMHICGWINRDVKLGNFCVGLEDNAQIYMIDFSFARRYK